MYTVLFKLETDAFDVTISAVLQQWSRTLNSNKKHHASVEKEAAAIVEAVWQWLHYLLPCKFTIITDQNSMAFMFGNYQHNKIKNDKTMQLRIELSQYFYDIVYCQGKFNVVSDILS